MNDHSDRSPNRNAATRDSWDSYAGHRQRVMQLLDSAIVQAPARLCVLGAGNGNDLELPALAKSYAEVHLVDMDATALEHAVTSQGVADVATIHRHAGIDLTGIMDTLDDWRPSRLPIGDELDACLVRAASAPLPKLPGPFDVVASICLLTQLYDGAVKALGSEHPRLLDLLVRIRLRHVRMMFELLRPGGLALLVSDFLSSDTFPALPDVPEDDLHAALIQQINQQNFFSGANPVVLRGVFTSDSQVAPLCAYVDLLPPWRWRLGPRWYAICALVSRKRIDAPEA